MGIDIRDGAQLECIQCALCIDACNDIMGKIDRPPNLIAYDTIARQDAATKGQTCGVQFLRPRTLLYAGMIALVGSIMLVAVLLRTTLEVNVLHERAPAFVLLSDGGIRNAYIVKILNKRHEPRDFRLDLAGFSNASLSIAGGVDAQKIRVNTDDLRELRVFVTMTAGAAAALRNTAPTPFTFVVTDIASNTVSTRATHFQK
jgi:polyferredoxin